MPAADASIYALGPALAELRAASARFRHVFDANYPLGSPIAWRDHDGRVRHGRVAANGFVGGKLCVKRLTGRAQWIGPADILTPDQASAGAEAAE